MRTYGLRDPEAKGWCSYKKAMWRDTNTETGKRTMRRWRNKLQWSSYKPRKLKIAGNYQKWERGKEGFSPTVFKESMTLPTCWLLASLTLREYISVLLSRPICDTLLWQLWEINAEWKNMALESDWPEVISSGLSLISSESLSK